MSLRFCLKYDEHFNMQVKFVSFNYFLAEKFYVFFITSIILLLLISGTMYNSRKDFCVLCSKYLSSFSSTTADKLSKQVLLGPPKKRDQCSFYNSSFKNLEML